MSDSGERHLYEGLQALSKKTDRKLLELQRWARVSFDLEVSPYLESGGFNDRFVLRYAQEYSRHKRTIAPIELGSIMLAKKISGDDLVFNDNCACPKEEFRKLGRTLKEKLLQFETPPAEAAARNVWESEAFDGEGKPLLPVAIHGINYFHHILYKGQPLAPLTLQTYRTNDSESQKFLENLIA